MKADLQKRAALHDDTVRRDVEIAPFVYLQQFRRRQVAGLPGNVATPQPAQARGFFVKVTNGAAETGLWMFGEQSHGLLKQSGCDLIIRRAEVEIVALGDPDGAVHAGMDAEVFPVLE